MSSEDKYFIWDFFQKLRAVSKTVATDVREIQVNMEKSKFQCPENAMLKLTVITREANVLKDNSHALLQQLVVENQHYNNYHEAINLLVIEMERGIDHVEEILSGYGYQKWFLQPTFQDDSDKGQAASCSTGLHEALPLPKIGVAEKKTQLCWERTPVLSDFGLTAILPSNLNLPSTSKDKGNNLKLRKKSEHFESSRQAIQEKENVVLCSLKITPATEERLPCRQQSFVEVNQRKDLLCVKKHLSFRSPLGSISNVPQSDATVEKADSMENFGELDYQFPPGLKVSCPVDVFREQTDNEKPSANSTPNI